MKFIYTPAIQVWAYTANLQYRDNTLTFWREKDLFQYPYFLFAAPYGIEAKCKMELPKEGIVILDSGGYEQVSKGVDYDPKEIINYQQENSTCGFILDYPPYSFGGHAQFTGDASQIFNISLQKTKHNAQVMLENKRENYDLYGVIQGQTLPQLKKWHSEIASTGDFKSWALSPKPSSDLFQVAQYLLYAHENNFKKIHILQVSGFSGVALLAYYASKYFKGDLLTFDSSTWIRYGSGMKRYSLTPFRNMSVRINPESRITTLGCRCPVCSKYSLDEMKPAAGINSMMISLHNLYLKINECNILYELARKDEEGFGHVTKKKKISSVFDYIDYGIEHGIEKASQKYIENFKYDDIVKKQFNLFNYSD